MGCFFGCFRFKDDDRHAQSRLVSVVSDKSREPIISRNRLSSLLHAEEDKDGLLSNKQPSPVRTPDRQNGDKELKEEARYLKACGILPETPAEIRKTSTRFQYDGDSPSSKFHSWLPNTSIEKLGLEKHPYQTGTPIKLGEHLEQGSDSVLHTPISSCCISNGQDAGNFSRSSNIGSEGGLANSQTSSTGSSSVTSGAIANTQGRSKYVRFEDEDNTELFSSRTPTSEVAGQNLKNPQSAANFGQSKLSPYPTPLKISDDMQTPGTVFPSNVDGRNYRVRSQYVYSSINPVENLTHWETLKEEDLGTPEMSESRVAVDQIVPEDARTGGPSVHKVEASLSSWLKPPPTNQDGNNEYAKGQVGRTPGDRPIIGLVAAHWNEDEVSRVSPKYWDGNGIPNSTNKYKEDQKVSWHATPFEERLEKALSNETSTFQRRRIDGTPVDFDETDEVDTALSEMKKCSTHVEPVVSF